MNRDRLLFAIVSEMYRGIFPHAKLHHMMPSSRNGPDTEFNLFPWNEAAHTAWHRLFSIMTIREVWPLLPDIHLQLFQTQADTLVREWCWPFVERRCLSERNDVLTPQNVEELRKYWIICFGGTKLHHAEGLLRYMMLFMIFGRHADRSAVIYESAQLRSAMHSVQKDSERNWAFRQCFQVLPTRAHSRNLRTIIRQVRAITHTIPIH